MCLYSFFADIRKSSTEKTKISEGNQNRNTKNEAKRDWATLPKNSA